MSYYQKQKAISIAGQVGSIKKYYPQFTTSFKKELLKVHGWIQPTSRSDNYEFQLKYHFKSHVDVKILSPELIKNEKGENIPHMYNQESLCLFHPSFGEFKFSYLIANTVIPWISLWLYYYENWHTTGEWLGGGIHPSKRIRQEI